MSFNDALRRGAMDLGEKDISFKIQNLVAGIRDKDIDPTDCTPKQFKDWAMDIDGDFKELEALMHIRKGQLEYKVFRYSRIVKDIVSDAS